MHKLFSCFVILLFISLVPKVYASSSIQLSLDEAVLLGVRTNPNVQSSRLRYVLTKFNLYVANWQFSPHYSLSANAGLNRQAVTGQDMQGSHSYGLTAAIDLKTRLGTDINLSSTHNKTSHYNPGVSLTITQPLMRGFGPAIVEAALLDARDSELIARMEIEDKLRTVVTNIINAYLDVISASQRIQNDIDALDRAKQSVRQTILFIKAGRKAGNEIVTVKANVASAQSQLENDKNASLQARYALLRAIGLDPNLDVKFTTLALNQLLEKYHFPPLAETVQKALKNDIGYQSSIITLNGSTKRSVLMAEDNARWKLDLELKSSIGGGGGGGKSAGIDSLFNGSNQGQSVNLNLTIPINDKTLEQAILNAKIALKEAIIALKSEKWEKETNAINNWNSVKSADRALRFAEEAKILQEKTYQISYQKYLHGLIDSLELQSAQVRLIQEQQAMLSAQINYLKSLINLDYLVGNTLKTWKVGVRV